jgi:hypothetical protein
MSADLRKYWDPKDGGCIFGIGDLNTGHCRWGGSLKCEKDLKMCVHLTHSGVVGYKDKLLQEIREHDDQASQDYCAIQSHFDSAKKAGQSGQDEIDQALFE